MSQVEFHRDQIFHRLPEPLCQTLFDTGKTRSGPAGDIILNEGEKLHHLYIVLEGRTEALLPKTGSRVNSVRLNVLGPGDCFGEYAFIDQLPLGDEANYSGTMLTEAAEGADAVRSYMSETAPFITSFHVEDAVIDNNSADVLVKYQGINGVQFEGTYSMDFENDQIVRIRTVFDSRPLMTGGLDQ